MTEHLGDAVETFVVKGQTIRIRPATEADRPAVVALDKESTGIDKPEYWADFFERCGSQKGLYFLVAESQGKILGFIIGEIRAWEFGSPPCGWVFGVNVLPSARLLGVASRMLDAVCACFRKAGVTKVRTLLARDNHLIMAFFRSQGMMAGPSIQLEMDLE